MLKGTISLLLLLSPAGQEGELVHRGQFPQPIIPWSEVDIFWGLGRAQGKVLQCGGQEEEEL